MWEWLASREAATGQDVRLRARFAGDADAQNPITIVLSDGTPRAELPPQTRALFDQLDPDEIAAKNPSLGPFGWVLTPHAEGYWLDADDGMLRDFRPGPNPDVWLLHAVRDGFGNRIALHYDNGNLAEIHDSVGRRVALSHDERGHLTALRFVRQQGEAVLGRERAGRSALGARCRRRARATLRHHG